MSVASMGRDISEHGTIDRVFPKQTTMALDEYGIGGEALDDIAAIIFPTGKLMWPIHRLSHNMFERGEVVRSMKDSQYSPMRIFTICADERGAWVFVQHANETQNLAGFVATLDGTLVQPFGNVEPIEVSKWISTTMPRSQRTW